MEPQLNQPSPQQSQPEPMATGGTSQPVSPAKSKKKMLIGVTLAVCVIAAIGVIIYLINPNGVFTASSSSQESNAIVKITDNGFIPSTIKVKKGQTIEWQNNSTQPHQLAADSAKNADQYAQQPLAVGDTYTVGFDTTGTFTYHDQLNPVTFKGTVIVE